MNSTVSWREKNRIYVMTLVSRDKRRILGYDVAFDRSRERIQKLVDNSAKASKYYSDAYSACAEVCYEGIHTSLKNKSQTYTVEGINSDLRHYIPALHRRSKCFFRSIETMNAVFKIFVNALNKFTLAKFLYPHLKFAFAFSYFI